MKVKMLKDLNYSLDGVRPITFTKGLVTDKFSDEVAKHLISRKIAIDVAAVNDSVKTPAEIEAAEKASKELGDAVVMAAKLAEKFKTRKEEILKAGAELVDGQFQVLDIRVIEDDILQPTDKQWAGFITDMIGKVKEAKEAKEKADKDELLGLGNESEKGAKVDSKKTTTKNKNSNKK